jgi:hypothetical protein
MLFTAQLKNHSARHFLKKNNDSLAFPRLPTNPLVTALNNSINLSPVETVHCNPSRLIIDNTEITNISHTLSLSFSITTNSNIQLHTDKKVTTPLDKSHPNLIQTVRHIPVYSSPQLVVLFPVTPTTTPP